MSWSEVKKINSDLSKTLDTLIKEYLANSNYGLNALVSGKVPIVKSVQRGSVSSKTITSSSKTVEISISSVNPKKCIVLIGEVNSSRVSYSYVIPYGINLSATKLSIQCMNGDYDSTLINFSWQVIEFY